MGTMSFGGSADEAESRAMYRSCREAGINFFDCANVYNGGRAEEILGKLIKEERDEIFLTSKYTFPPGDGPNSPGSSRLNAVRELERSLKRLKTDRIDLYFIHSFDPFTAMEESLRALDDLVRAGKILYIGVSNWAAWQIMKGLGLSERFGWSRIACIQPMYNLVKRQAEVEILPMARSEKLGVITYSPLGGGVLVRPYDRHKEAESGRLAENPNYRLRYGGEGIFEAAASFRALASARGMNPATLGVAWVASHPAVTAPIIGARDNRQLQDSLAAAELSLDGELRDEVSSLFPAPSNATDRTEEELDKGFGLRS